ncbi:MAG: primosomal protein N', partial [Thermodesulfobacteriota bacterium]
GKGFLREEVSLRGGGKKKTESIVSIAGGGGGGGALAGLKRSPLQAKVLSFLMESGPVSLKSVREALGGVDDAVRRLKEKGLITVTEREVARDPAADIEPRAMSHDPNKEQQAALDAITASLGGKEKEKKFSPYLLWGITGSGKTLVYLKVIEEVVRSGRRALMLVPEISLTSRATAYLTHRFPGRVAVVHSALGEGERYDQWRRILRGEVDVVIGARSALFSPIKELGVIVVDEEHDPSYKQDEGIRYNARDSALMLGKFLGITVVLGSATPSVETFHNATTGRITPLYIRNRVARSELPTVELMDMRGNKGAVLSERLRDLIGETLDQGHQALLFLNRRGFSNFLACRDCGHTFECRNCSVTLTVHKRARRLKCHYCDMEMPIPGSCPGCSSHNLVDPGVGTEKVEEEVRALFPGARVGRMDSDTTRRKGTAKEILDAVESGEMDVLVGTQMVSKGHHLPGITLVGVVSGDTSLNIPDFRGPERSFQLLSQASGRAGRGEAPARVVIQTLNPEHFCFTAAAAHDYEGFFAEEIEMRREVGYPPFTRLCCMRVDGTSEKRAEAAAVELRGVAERALPKAGGEKISVLGPAPALLSKLKGRYRWQLLVKAGDAATMNAFLRKVKKDFDLKKHAGVKLTLDVDPVMTV